MTLRFADVAPLDPDLPWARYSIPGSRPPVSLLHLEIEDGSGASTSLVRFPPGWARSGPGHYACGEEFVVLAGGLSACGLAFAAGDHGWIPAATGRGESGSPAGALALAHFTGVPTWHDDPAPAAGTTTGGTSPARCTSLPTVPIPDRGLQLCADRSGTTRLLERAPERFDSPARVLWLGGPGDTTGTDDPFWAAYLPGTPVPRRNSGRVVVHLPYSI